MPPDHLTTPQIAKSFPSTQRALARHIPISEHLLSIQCFVKLGPQWFEAGRLGRPADGDLDRLLGEFDATQGGVIEPLAVGQGWLGRYMTRALDRPLCFVMQFPPVPAEQLTGQLERIETQVGWVALAVLADCQNDGAHTFEDGEFLHRMLVDAPGAKSRLRLAQQWIGHIERWADASLVAVFWQRAHRPQLAAVSGSGQVERHSEARSHLEALVGPAVHGSQPMLWTANQTMDALGPEDSARVHAGLHALDLEGAFIFPVRAGKTQTVEAVVLIGLVPGSEAEASLRRGSVWLLDALSQSLAIQGAANPAPMRRLGRWLVNTLAGWVGPTLWRLKLALLLIIGVTVWAAWTPMVAEPGFSARIEAQQKRVISAPFDGFIQSAPYRLGDRIPEGNAVLQLDTSEMQLELARQKAELAEIELELQSARGRRDAAQVRRLTARESQIQIAIELLRTQITNAVNAADEASLVLGGDAWQRIGERVRLGEPLLEIASARDLRVLAFVDQDWITSIDHGIDVRVQLSALPDQVFVGSVESIGTDTRAIDGVTTFPVWIGIPAALSNQVMDGMRGVVRMPLAETTVLAFYTRGIRRWIERQLWRWF